MLNFVLVISILFASEAVQALDENECRLKIENSIYVEGTAEPTKDPLYVLPFLEAYELLPPKAKKFMCKFDRFNIANLISTATSDMEFRKGIFDARIDSSHWHTWKEQLNFGVKNDNHFEIRTKLPRIKTTDGVTFLYWVILHELGHNISYDKEQWHHFTIEDRKNFPEWEKLCFYKCTRYFPARRVHLLYEKLFSETNFLSLYSSTKPTDNWAEAFMFYVAIEVTGLDFVINMPSGRKYSVKRKLRSWEYKDRRASIIKFYNAMDSMQPKSKSLSFSKERFTP